MSAPEPPPQPQLQALRDAAAAAAQRGDATAALAWLRRAHETAPGDLETAVQLGEALRQAGELDDAQRVLETAKAIWPDDPSLALQLGRTYRALGHTALARRAFELVLALEPDGFSAREALVLIEIGARNYEAAAVLASAASSAAAQSQLFELICVEAVARGDAAAAQTYGRLAFERLPSANSAMTLARAHFQAGDDTATEQMLHWILSRPDIEPTLAARAIGTLADLADRRGAYAQALPLYVKSKLLLRHDFERTQPQLAGSFCASVERLAASAARVGALARPRDHAARRGEPHIFLLGFPRTGTTLLEQCFAGYPGLITSDENGALRTVVAPYVGRPDPFRAFAQASDAELCAMRDEYWRRMRQISPTASDTPFVDKMPFNSVYAGFIPALFPSARIVFAIRDPRDVVFSCFRRRFGMSSATYELCTIEGSVRLYCAVMSLFETIRAGASDVIVDCRYEDVVRDLKGALAPVCAFVGLDWRDEMEQFAERARQRPLFSLTAPQLTQGLYDGRDSWRGYAEFLAPFADELAPWLKRFGYV